MKVSFVDHKRRYKSLFSNNPDGKYILHELMSKFYITSPTFKKGDSQEDYLLKEGMRQVVLYIMQQTNYDIDSYLANMEKYKMEMKND